MVQLRKWTSLRGSTHDQSPLSIPFLNVKQELPTKQIAKSVRNLISLQNVR